MSETVQGFSIREATTEDADFLDQMLLQAIVLPSGAEVTPEEVWQMPETRVYVEGWGRAGDFALLLLDDGEPVGACWCRLWTKDKRGFGFVAEDIPELSVALFSKARGQGQGTRLMEGLLQHAMQHYRAISLSVEGENPALRLYERLGFEKVEQVGTSWTMLRRF